MIWIFELIYAFYFGFHFASLCIQDSLDIIFRFFCGIPIGCFSLAWFHFILSLFVPLNYLHGIISIIVFAILSLILRHFNSKHNLKMKIKWPRIQLGSLTIISIIFCYIIFFGLLFNDSYCLGAAYGDLPFHLNVISSFATGGNYKRSSLYDINTTFYSGTRLAYPFMTNFLSSSLISTGLATIRCSIFFPSIFISLSLIFGIYALSYEFSNNIYASVLALTLFFFTGGLGWTRLFTSKTFTDPNYFNGVDFVYDWPEGRHEYWFHPIIHVLVPQRASLFSMPLCYWAILMLILGIELENTRFFVLAGVLTGFMPLVQVHSYVAIAQWSIIFCILTFPYTTFKKWKKYILMWSVFGIVANAMAFPQLIPFFNRITEKKDQFIRINPIFMGKGPFNLWWNGLGPFAAISILFGWVNLNRRQVILYLPSLFVFITTNIIRYQPWEMDNTKLFYAGWIPLALSVVSIYICKLFKFSAFFFLGLFIFIFMILSSLLALLISLCMIPQLYHDRDWNFGFWINENTPTKAIFAVDPIHNHPVATFAGRQLLMGYGGWVVSHGLDYSERNNINMRIGNNPKDIFLANMYDISYVVSSNGCFPEYEKINGSNRYWAKIYDDSFYKVWKKKTMQ